MTSRATHLKLGLLAITAVIAGFAIAFTLGLRRAPTDTYRSYFDESVQGLDVGASVRFRGVPIGRVAGIAIAPDHRHVEVELAIERDIAGRLRLDELRLGLRARLSIQGVTGLKFVDLDVAEPDEPAEPLPFDPAPRHIPSSPSLLEHLGDDLASVGRRVPEVLDRAASTLAKLERLLDDLDRAHVPARVAAVLDSADLALADARRLVASVDRARVPARLSGTLDQLGTTIARARRVLDDLDGVGELMTSARRTADTFNDVGQTTQDASTELEGTLHDVGEAARALRDFLDEVDRDPDILLKGRGRSRRP